MIELLSVTASNLLSPMVLFFALGLAAALLRSDLTVPAPVTSGLALYLMLSIGFRGGAELAQAGISTKAVYAAASGLVLGFFLLPGIAFLILTRLGRLDPVNAGAVAAHYGSVSVVTFITATGFLSHLGVTYESFMVALVALMEAPGAIAGIFLARVAGPRAEAGVGNATTAVWRETLFGSSPLLLLGSLVIGAVTGEKGMHLLKPFVADAFPGALCLFLLEMGLTAGRRLPEFLRLGRFLIAFGVAMPLLGGGMGVLAGYLAGLSPGGATLLAVLAASASYIAAPAAVRLALPQANPGLPITLSLGVTFPFNILLGIPLYYTMAGIVYGL